MSKERGVYSDFDSDSEENAASRPRAKRARNRRNSYISDDDDSVKPRKRRESNPYEDKD